MRYFLTIGDHQVAIRRYKGEKVETSGGVELVRGRYQWRGYEDIADRLLNAGNIESHSRAVTVTMVTMTISCDIGDVRLQQR